MSPAQLDALGIQTVSIETQDQETLHALYLPNNNSKLLTIFFHGNGGNLHNRIPVLKRLQSMESSVLGISYRGYLNSTGVSTEKGVYEDARAALEYAGSSLGFDEQNIVIFGRSLGSAVAIDVAQGKNLFGLVLVSPFTNSRAIFDGLPPLARLIVRDKKKSIDTSFRNVEKAANIHSRTLVMHGTADTIIPFQMGKKVFEALPQSNSEKRSKTFVALDGADHNNFGYTDLSEVDKLYWSAIEEILNNEENE